MGPTPTPSPSATLPGEDPFCFGDCDENGTVGISELLRLVNIALNNQPVAACVALERRGIMTVAVNQIVLAVNYALGDCPLS